jgi:DNA invertase Pin-like site-specific DNA recombinase
MRHPDEPLRAGVYARVRFEDALDLPKQGHALTAFAEQKGWKVVLTEHEVAAENALRLNARGRLLQVAKNGELDVIVAWKLDRIARSLPELVSLIDGLQVHGVAMATLADDFDFTSNAAPELTRIIRVLSTFQRVTHRDQVRSGLARSENPTGRPSSAGLHLQEVLALTALGHSQREIARRLGIHPRTVARMLANLKP